MGRGVDLLELGEADAWASRESRSAERRTPVPGVFGADGEVCTRGESSLKL